MPVSEFYPPPSLVAYDVFQNVRELILRGDGIHLSTPWASNVNARLKQRSTILYYNEQTKTPWERPTKNAQRPADEAMSLRTCTLNLIQSTVKTPCATSAASLQIPYSLP
jgi:hypothetical protein